MEAIKDFIDRLNITDECANLEAKRGGAIHRSIMETVCAFSNEPGLQGGHILLGVERDDTIDCPYYMIIGVSDPDKLQLDFATQCASAFNFPVRPEIEVESVGSAKTVIKILIHELPSAQKPLYFKSEGLPQGSYRRIGSSDQRCTDDDLYIFYNKEDSLDSSLVTASSVGDLSDEAIGLYRSLRAKVNPYGEELTYNDHELLLSLGSVKKINDHLALTYSGFLVFGKRQSLRRVFPMARVDYIRVPGNEWVPDPENRFTTVDMRGPLVELVQRVFSAIADDLPKGFLLPEGQMQAESVGLPSKVLREAIVNAFIHRTYRQNQPIQIIRYGNRIEIKNPGFSLKPEEQFGEPGSRSRNPFIAAIFHETNLAETKGTGIRAMRTLMDQAGMVPPTFESDHMANLFTTRLLLHHFLSEEDISWLTIFDDYLLNDAQKRALIFVREVGAIDNPSYRQLNGCDILKASSELRIMRDTALLEQKGRGRATYYIPGDQFFAVTAPPPSLTAPPPSLTAPPPSLTAPPPSFTAPPQNLIDILPEDLKISLHRLGKRSNDKEAIRHLIVELCNYKSMTVNEISSLIARSEKYVLREFITPLREAGQLHYTLPNMPNHPAQSYKSPH
jgi:ATP-dependent DNA helicase RecG